MNAQEMFDTAKKKAGQSKKGEKVGRYYLHPNGLKIRTFHIITRYNDKYIISGRGMNAIVNVDQIRKDVLSGEILKVRNFGDTLLKEVCEWLEDKDNEAAREAKERATVLYQGK